VEGRFGPVVALSPNGKTFAAVEERPKSCSVGETSNWISVFEIASNKLFGGREIKGACKVQQTEGDTCRDYLPPMWSPDGSFVAYADGPLGRNTLHIWHPFGENIMDRDVTIKVPFNIIALSPDGSAVAVDDFDDSVTIVRSKNGKPL